MFSVLIPSRGRPDLLRRSVASLRSTAGWPDDIQVVVAADDDDIPTVEAAAEVRADCVVTSRFGYEGLHKYYQKAYDLSRGEWVMVWNDDATMQTRSWDMIISELPHNVLVADIQTNHSPLCCYPAIRRSAIEDLGHFSSENPHVDTFWQDVGRALDVIRVVDVHAVAETPVKPGQTHRYYEAKHQSELFKAIDILREAIH